MPDMTIGETVRRGQDTLARFQDRPQSFEIPFHLWSWGDPEKKTIMRPPAPVMMPQSLGELCLEAAQEAICEGANSRPALPGGRWQSVEFVMEDGVLSVPISISLADTRALRLAMWHKEKA